MLLLAVNRVAWIALWVSVACLHAAEPVWLQRVSPLLSPAEKRAYLALAPEARIKFEEAFWAEKNISSEEYFSRLQYVDAQFGSNKIASGGNTDQGRIYLSLGPPHRVTHLPSSRIFVPIEIWYYSTVPAIGLTTELRLIFYQKNALGFPKLYSPTLDTVRALLLPEAGTAGMFGPNDDINEASIRTKLATGAVEDEVIDAAVNVAAGIKRTGNDEILGLVSSPQAILGKPTRTEVTSRLVLSHPKFEFFESSSSFGARQIDLWFETPAKRQLLMEVFAGNTLIYQNQIGLSFSTSRNITYTHRLDLLPGSYRVILTVDGAAHPYALETQVPRLLRANRSETSSGRRVPFEFDGFSYQPDVDGPYVILPLSTPGSVTWTVRRGTETVLKTTSEGNRAAALQIPFAKIGPGRFTLEAVSAAGVQTIPIEPAPDRYTTGVAISFNANLAPASRYALIGHQWLLRGNLAEARKSLESASAQGSTREVEVELARAETLSGNLDTARERVRAVLAQTPRDFEALSIYAYIETQFQDYAVAAELYRRALDVQDSPSVRLALSQLPQVGQYPVTAAARAK